MTTSQTENKTPPVWDMSTKLAFERTYLAYERTQQAWVRTSLALISFGFTINQVFERFHDKDIEVQQMRLFGARTVGLLMISIGLLALMLAAVQHRRARLHLQSQYPDLPKSIFGPMTILFGSLGIVALIVALLRQ